MLHQTMNDKTEEQLAVGTSCGLFKRSFVLNPTENPSLSIEMITHLNYRTTAKAKAKNVRPAHHALPVSSTIKTSRHIRNPCLAL
jgi:hypothetical protein